MRTAWQCESTWSPGLCRGTSKPLDLAPGQKSLKNWRVLQNHFMTTFPCKDRYNWYLQEIGLGCFVLILSLQRTAELRGPFETRCRSWSEKVWDLTLTYSNPCKAHALVSLRDKSNGPSTGNMTLGQEEELQTAGCVQVHPSQSDTTIVQLIVFAWWVTQINLLSALLTDTQTNDSPGSAGLPLRK